MALLVTKFGGSSLANMEKLKNAAQIIAAEHRKENQVVVVVSAQGDTTDDLLDKAARIGEKLSDREMDVLLSTGEQMSIALMSMMLHSLSVPAVSLCGWQAGIRTDDTYGRARISEVAAARLREELARGQVVVVAGFQGLNPRGDITTIGRGGSDTTAVALAAALEADVCRIYTDVDGVYSADPRLVKDAVRHFEINYDEMLELASMGAQVLHNRAVEMAKRFGVQLQVLSSFKQGVGTRVREVLMEQKNVTGVALDRAVAYITVQDMQQGDGCLCSLLSVLAERKINIDMIIRTRVDGRETIAFSLARKDVPAAVEALELSQETLRYQDFSVDEQMCKVSIVGAGMAANSGVAAQMMEALHQAGVEVRAIATSEIKISVMVPEDLGEYALRAVHESFF